MRERKIKRAEGIGIDRKRKVERGGKRKREVERVREIEIEGVTKREDD